MKWNKKEAPAELVKEIAARYGCDFITASILIRRDVTTPEALLYFLESDKRYLRNAFLMPGVEDAVERVLAAMEEGEKVLVFGDRDTDGITSTSLLVGFLERNGVDASWELPRGDEPYGLSIGAIDRFAKENGSLIITVDCGISNFNEIQYAAGLNIDVIVTDHHRPHETLPEAYAIVNPKVKTDGVYRYPFQELAGCGVAYKLVCALRFALKSPFYGHSICFLNVEPAAEGSWTVDILKTRNFAAVDRLTELIVPGTVGITGTRLPAFLEGQQIFVYDAAEQKKRLQAVFGRGVEFGMFDCAQTIAQALPQTAGKSLVRLKEISRIAHYSSAPLHEVDVFFNLFVSAAQRAENGQTDDDLEDLQLAAIGTIADLMPLEDENRLIVRNGLAALIKKPRPGVSELLYRLNLGSRNLSSVEISWHLTPAINAAGRLGEPEIPVKLFLCKDRLERDRLANRVMELNEQRRKLADSTWDEKVSKRAEGNKDRFSGRLAFADGNDIKRGVTGVMANRLANKYRLPSLILSYTDTCATGSMRSLRGYDLKGILDVGKDLFIDSGGHDYAAGFSLSLDKVDEFLARLGDFSATIELDSESDFIEVDAELPLQYVTPDALGVVDALEPYGKGHKELNFLAQGLAIADIGYMGKIESKHAKFTLDTGKYKWPALYWGGAERASSEFKIGDSVRAIFFIRRNFFNGMEIPQMIITDIEKMEKMEKTHEKKAG